MNEIEALRQQVGQERRHMAAVKNALAATLETDDPTTLDFCARCVAYLLFIMRRFNAQDRAHVDTLLPRLPPDAESDRSVLRGLADALAANESLMAELAAAHARFVDSPQDAGTPLRAACRRYVEFYDAQLKSRKHGFYHLMEKHYSLADWRRVSMVSADSILQERRLFAQVRELAPAGVMIEP